MLTVFQCMTTEVSQPTTVWPMVARDWHIK
jgi:hypothetical protein